MREGEIILHSYAENMLHAHPFVRAAGLSQCSTIGKFPLPITLSVISSWESPPLVEITQEEFILEQIQEVMKPATYLFGGHFSSLLRMSHTPGCKPEGMNFSPIPTFYIYYFVLPFRDLLSVFSQVGDNAHHSVLVLQPSYN